MIITCENCNKKFKLDINLLGKNGRFLQCGNCKYKWFFKPLAKQEKNEKSSDSIASKNLNKNVKNEPIIINKIDNYKNNKKKIKKKSQFISYFFISLITFISIIIILDTFKLNISAFLPEIVPFLNNLYASLYDLLLFLKDLLN